MMAGVSHWRFGCLEVSDAPWKVLRGGLHADVGLVTGRMDVLII